MLFLASQAKVDRFQGLETIDYVAVITYFVGVLALGYYFSKRQRHRGARLAQRCCCQHQKENQEW